MEEKKNKVKKVKPFMIVAALVVAFVGYKVFSGGTGDVSEALKKEMVPLKTVQAKSGFEDMEPLKEMLKDKQIVAMGEATHGTSDFFKMKHRMFEFLVEEMDFRVFAIEGEFGAAQVINDYILNGTGSARDGLKAMSWIGDTEEVVEMIEWMREFNNNNERKIKFYGFDMQNPNESVKRLIGYLEKVDSSNYKEYVDKLKKLEGVYESSQKEALERLAKSGGVDTNSSSIVDFATIEANIDQLQGLLNRDKETFLKNSSEAENKMALQLLKNISQCVKEMEMNLKLTTYDQESFNFRDKSMAENVKWILDYESGFGNDKVMLWAHNGHVSKSISNYSTMGGRLKDLYGSKYYSIGFEFYSGTFNALKIDPATNSVISLDKFTIEKCNEKALATVLNNAGVPLGFIDFKSAAKNHRINKFLSTGQYMHYVGATYTGVEDQTFELQKPIRDYDGLIFISNTTESKMLKE